MRFRKSSRHTWPPRRTSGGRARAAAALPEHLDVRPAVFWKAFLDAGSFFVLYLLVAIAAEYRLLPAF